MGKSLLSLSNRKNEKQLIMVVAILHVLRTRCIDSIAKINIFTIVSIVLEAYSKFNRMWRISGLSCNRPSCGGGGAGSSDSSSGGSGSGGRSGGSSGSSSGSGSSSRPTM